MIAEHINYPLHSIVAIVEGVIGSTEMSVLDHPAHLAPHPIAEPQQQVADLEIC